MKVYKLDDSRINEILKNKFSGNNENIYNQIQSFIDSNNLTMLAKIDIKIKHSYKYQFIDLLLFIIIYYKNVIVYVNLKSKFFFYFYFHIT